MSKKNFVIIGLIFTLLLVIISVIKFNSGYKIIISNNTDITISNLELKYKVGSTIKNISQIEPQKSWKSRINTNDVQGENAIILTYKDLKGNSYEEYVVGYLEKGYRGRANAVINKIDDNGKLLIDIK